MVFKLLLRGNRKAGKILEFGFRWEAPGMWSGQVVCVLFWLEIVGSRYRAWGCGRRGERKIPFVPVFFSVWLQVVWVRQLVTSLKKGQSNRSASTVAAKNLGKKMAS